MSLHFSAPAKQLLLALDAARAATPAAPSLTAYAGVKLDVNERLLTITGADGDVQIEALVHLASAATPGSVLVAPGPLAALLRGSLFCRLGRLYRFALLRGFAGGRILGEILGITLREAERQRRCGRRKK